jgi:hypothetical protein
VLPAPTEGNAVDFSSFKGKVCLVTNVACYCGLTSGGYTVGLEGGRLGIGAVGGGEGGGCLRRHTSPPPARRQRHRRLLAPQEMAAQQKKYGDQGLEVVLFPCNQFGGLEPGTPEQIKVRGQCGAGQRCAGMPAPCMQLGHLHQPAAARSSLLSPATSRALRHAPAPGPAAPASAPRSAPRPLHPPTQPTPPRPADLHLQVRRCLQHHGGPLGAPLGPCARLLPGSYASAAGHQRMSRPQGSWAGRGIGAVLCMCATG